MTFQINTARIPAEDSFWYRMALLDVQQALIDSGAAGEPEFEAVFDGLKTAWEDLFDQQQQARIAASCAV